MAQWSAHEDEQLRKLVKEYGPKRWSVIASKLKTKGSKQCRRRWKNHLNADLKSGGWTADEDRILLEGHRLYGNKWTEIAKMVGGRTDNAVKNRYAALCKRDAKGVQRGGHTRGGRGSRKPRTSDSDGGASDVEIDDDSDDNEEAKRTSSSSVSRDPSPVRHTRGHGAGSAAVERAAVNSTPTPPPQPRGGLNAGPSPPVSKAAADVVVVSETEPLGSTGVRSSFLGRRRQPGGGSPPLQPEPEAAGPAKRRAVLQGGGSSAGGGIDRLPMTTPQTPLVQMPQMQHQPQEALLTNYHQQQQQQRQGPERSGLGGRSGLLSLESGQVLGAEGSFGSQPAPLMHLHQHQQQLVQHQEAMCRSNSGMREVEIMASGQPKKLPLTINIPNAASAEPPVVQQAASASTVHGIEIRVLKDLLTPCEIQYARELNDMQLPLHINVDEDSGTLGGRGGGSCSLLGTSSEPPLTTSRQAAQNALTSLFSPGGIAGSAGSEFNDVLKWFQTGFTPRSACGDDMTPRLMSRMGLTPCGLIGSRGGAHYGEEAGMLGTGLTPKCLLDSGSPRSHGGGHSCGMGFTPHVPELSAAKRARRQVAVAAAVAAAASEPTVVQQPHESELASHSLGGCGLPFGGGVGVGSSSSSGAVGNSGGCGVAAQASAALGMTSPGGMELHAGHRQLLTKLIQTAAAADAGGLVINGNGACGSTAGDPVVGGSRFTPPSPSGGMVTPEPLISRSSLMRNFSGENGMGQAAAAAAAAAAASSSGDGTGVSSNQALNGSGVVVMPYFTQQELMLLLEVLNSEDLQALPPPPPPSAQ